MFWGGSLQSELWGGSLQSAVAEPLSAALLKQAPRISPEAIQMALTAFERLKASGAPVRSDVLTVIDYTKPSTEPRLWVFDLKHARSSELDETGAALRARRT